MALSLLQGELAFVVQEYSGGGPQVSASLGVGVGVPPVPVGVGVTLQLVALTQVEGTTADANGLSLQSALL